MIDERICGAEALELVERVQTMAHESSGTWDLSEKDKRALRHVLDLAMTEHEVVVAIDPDGNEALYLDGKLFETQGDTVFSCDIHQAAAGKLVRFKHVRVSDTGILWPELLDDLRTPSH